MDPKDMKGKLRYGAPVDKNVVQTNNIIDRQTLDGSRSSIQIVNLALGDDNKENVLLITRGKTNKKM